MYYQSPDSKNYVSFIIKYRKYVVAVYMMLYGIILAFYHPNILSSDAMFWLKESEQMQKSLHRNFELYTLSKLTVQVKKFDESTKKRLTEFNAKLEAVPGVMGVSSLFSRDLGMSEGRSSDSEMVGVVNVGDLNVYRVKNLVHEEHNAFSNLVDDTFTRFTFFIRAQGDIELSGLDIPGHYEYDTIQDSAAWNEDIIYLAVIVSVLVLLFRVLFKNFISSISAFFVISFSTILTFAVIYLLTGIHEIHMAMPFIAISIALVDFLFFYYRWHVSQYRHDQHNALAMMLERNAVPALWTSVITMLGLGSLVVVDSDIVRLLSLSVIVTSVVGYLVNLTFLPALLSYVRLKHAHVPYAKTCLFMASSELHYNKKFLYVFLAITFVLIGLGSYMIYGKSNSFFKLNVVDDQIEIKVPYEQIDLALIRSIDQFTHDLQTRFEDEIDEVVSLSTIVNNLNAANSQTDGLDEEALMQALFYLDLYGLSDKYFDADAVDIRINIADINKIDLIDWLAHYQPLEIYFVDKQTLLNSAKFGKTVLLTSSLLTALLLIGLIMGWIFRSKAMVFVGFVVNAIPIAWFGLMVKLLDIPLSLEMLIATTISVGLASDATIHFAFKYFRGRYFGRSRKQSLEKMYFYAGIPVIIGSAVMMSVFAALNFAQVHALQLIGTYSAVLILISLLTDLFVLPVMLLLIDRFAIDAPDGQVASAQPLTR